LTDRKDVDPTVREEEERRKDPPAADPIPQDLRMVNRVAEEQEAEAPRYRGEADQVGGALVPLRLKRLRQDDLRFERAADEKDRKPCQHESEAGGEPVPAHATPYHAAPQVPLPNRALIAGAFSVRVSGGASASCATSSASCRASSRPAGSVSPGSRRGRSPVRSM